MASKTYYVYILASRKNGTLYTGVTSDLEKRIRQHRQHLYNKSFTAKYHVTKLVYFEETADATVAIYREKQIKNWRRQWKINQINSINPDWKDLSENFVDSETSSE